MNKKILIVILLLAILLAGYIFEKDFIVLNLKDTYYVISYFIVSVFIVVLFLLIYAVIAVLKTLRSKISNPLS